MADVDPGNVKPMRVIPQRKVIGVPSQSGNMRKGPGKLRGQQRAPRRVIRSRSLKR